MLVWCQICRKIVPCEVAVQLIPCLHTFCQLCMGEFTKGAKICPSAHCYSPVQVPEHYLSPCEGERCTKKIAVNPDTLRTPCQHEICQACFDNASRRDKVLCPAPGCAEPLVDDEDAVCEGACKAPLVAEKTVVLPCCQARMCKDCAKKWTGGKETCEPGKCVPKERSGKRKKATEMIKTPCKGASECEGEVLRNFPSESECEHEVCLGCVATMLEVSEKSGRPPKCPNINCQLPYRCESVLALRSLFPEKKAYFAKFALDVHFSMQALKDETIMHIRTPNAAFLQHFSIKVCQCEDEENALSLDFVRTGTLGDLIREIRRVLKIMATDKIYGYYRRDSRMEKKLEVTQKNIHLTLEQLQINEVKPGRVPIQKTVILVDTTGIVSSIKTARRSPTPK